MSQKIVQINLKSNVPSQDVQQAWLPAAPHLSETPGLRWKIWLINSTDDEVGGIYLFDDEAAVQAFLNGPMVVNMKSDPTFSVVSIKTFDIMQEHTAITRGPVRTGVHV
jgi:hypothetical protein